MKRDDEIRKGEYEWEMKYKTNEKPLSKLDRSFKLLFTLIGLSATIAGLIKVFGIKF